MPVFTRRSRLTVAAAAAGLLAAGSPLAALKAAGLKGSMPVGGQAIAGLIGTLQSNWEWLIATGVGLVLVLSGGADDLRVDPRHRSPVSRDRGDHAHPRRHPRRPGLTPTAAGGAD